MMNIEDGKIVEKLAIIPDYGPIKVVGMPICRGCDKMALDVDEVNIYGGNKVAAQIRILQCANVLKCSELYARMLKERGNEND